MKIKENNKNNLIHLVFIYTECPTLYRQFHGSHKMFLKRKRKIIFFLKRKDKSMCSYF